MCWHKLFDSADRSFKNDVKVSVAWPTSEKPFCYFWLTINRETFPHVCQGLHVFLKCWPYLLRHVFMSKSNVFCFVLFFKSWKVYLKTFMKILSAHSLLCKYFTRLLFNHLRVLLLVRNCFKRFSKTYETNMNS